MSILSSIFSFAVNFLTSAGYLGVFVLMIMESATLPVPSEVVLPLAGFLVFTGKFDFWLVVILASIGSLIGTTIDYALGYYLGRAAISRYGRYVGMNEKHLSTSERWFGKYGEIAVLLARFVPLVRTLIAFPAGIAEMSFPRFFAFSSVGIIIWDAILTYIGYVAGQNWQTISQNLQSIFDYIGIAAIILVIVLLFVWFRTGRGKVEPKVAPDEKKKID